MTDWNPSDPETIKVHYDVTAWSLEQRAELAEALADASIPHAWYSDDDLEELVVPEEVEAAADQMFEQLEAVFGPFPIGLGLDDPSVEYGLDEWSDTDRAAMRAAVVEAAIPHRWEGTTLWAAADAESAVDQLLDALEAGTLSVHTEENAPPENVLSELFATADRLAKDADDRGGKDTAIALAAILSPTSPPYGVAGAAWARIVGATRRLSELSFDDTASSSDVIGAAQELRSLVRQYV